MGSAAFGGGQAGLGCISLQMVLNDAGDELVGDFLVVGELEVAFGASVGFDGFFEGGVVADGGVEADVGFEGGVVDDHAVAAEGGHFVADDFGGIWCGGADGAANLFEEALHLGREEGDVGVDFGVDFGHLVRLPFGKDLCCRGGECANAGEFG